MGKYTHIKRRGRNQEKENALEARMLFHDSSPMSLVPGTPAIASPLYTQGPVCGRYTNKLN